MKHEDVRDEKVNARRGACLFAVAMLLAVSLAHGGTKITFDDSGVMSVGGKKTFVVSFALPPPPDGKTPAGTDAFAELRDAGANYMRLPAVKESWDDEQIATVRGYLDAAAKNGML